MSQKAVVVGTGHAGATAALQLRKVGFRGSITLVGREPDFPYERPPLSKEYMLGLKDFERLYLHPPTLWSEKNIDLRLSTDVVRVEPEKKTLILQDTSTIGYDILIWAAGGEARKLNCPGANLPGVHLIRTRLDVDKILNELGQVRRAAIVGGGFIGLEAASAFRQLKKNVTLLEQLPRVLARVTGPILSEFYEAEHRAQGVDLRTGVSVAAIEGAVRVEGVRLSDGTFVEAQLVIVGIGISPAVQPLLAVGASGADGLFVDEFCRTSLPNIYAIGDCAAHLNPFADGAEVRLESIQNANDQATCAANSIIGDPKPYYSLPWFWSNQYDLRLQTIGLSARHDQAVIRGDRRTRSFSVIYLKEGRVIALDCMNCVKDYVQGRKLVENRASVSAALLADPNHSLKSLFITSLDSSEAPYGVDSSLMGRSVVNGRNGQRHQK